MTRQQLASHSEEFGAEKSSPVTSAVARPFWTAFIAARLFPALNALCQQRKQIRQEMARIDYPHCIDRLRNKRKSLLYIFVAQRTSRTPILQAFGCARPCSVAICKLSFE